MAKKAFKGGDFKLGNFLIDNKTGLTGVVTGISENKVQMSNEYMVEMSDIVPVEIDEKGILAIGFEKIYENWYECYIDNCLLTLTSRSEILVEIGGGRFCEDPPCVSHYKYIHQLQNLISDLEPDE